MRCFSLAPVAFVAPRLSSDYGYSTLRESNDEIFDLKESPVVIRNCSNFDWQSVLDDIVETIDDVSPHLTEGKVADYIPALAQVKPDQFGIAFTDVCGNTFKAGAADEPFSIQSISKVFALVLALDMEGEALWKRVGREPSGSAFNSIVQLESECGRPRNPLINAGAIAVTNTIVEHCGEEDGIDRIVRFLKECAQEKDGIRLNEKVAESEDAYGDRNRALAYFMRSYGVIQGDVLSTLACYFRQCALEMSVATLSRAGLFLAADGKNPLNGNAVVTSRNHVERVNSIMLLCGHYDMSGDFAFRVGLAGKSGVGGGILAVVPGIGTIAVWSPPLNKAGNSLAGTLALELFSKRTGVNIF
jgi:glutaminase